MHYLRLLFSLTGRLGIPIAIGIRLVRKGIARDTRLLLPIIYYHVPRDGRHY
jgi:hypothetical protein